MPLRYRDLPAREISNRCFKIIIDNYYTNGLVIVDFYPNSTGGLYNLYSFGYGSLATAIKVVSPLIPIYIHFPYPIYTSKVV